MASKGQAGPDLFGGSGQLSAQAMAERDRHTVLDALCLAGAPRGKTWLMQFLRALEWRSADGTHALSNDEITQACQQLVARGEAHAVEGIGWRADPVARDQRWPALWRHPQAPTFWRAWAWATGGGIGNMAVEPHWVSLRTPDDGEAITRLALLTRPAVDEFNRLLHGPLNRAITPEALLLALAEPFDAEFLAALSPALLWGLVERLLQQLPGAMRAFPALRDWLDTRLANLGAAADQVPAGLWLELVEQRLLALQPAACRAALAQLNASSPVCGIFNGLLQLQAGHWAEGTATVADSLKAAAKLVGKRNRLVPERVTRWHALGLLAQGDVESWTAARKFALAEAGSRSPAPTDGWGRIAHAAAVRLGDERPVALAFDAPQARWSGRVVADDEAMRLVLAAWLGHAPQDWTAPRVQAVADALRRQGEHWLAELLDQACRRLGWPQPQRPDDAPPPWPVDFFPPPVEPWREALAAIAALDTPAAATASGAAAPLHWRLTLDAAGRPHDLQAFERGAPAKGGRGAVKGKPLGLATLKKATRLDARDAAVARCLRQADWNRRLQWLDLAAAVLALVGHPDLALADAPEQPVMLEEGRPTVEMRRERAADGSECYRLQVLELGSAHEAPPALDHQWDGVKHEEEAARRDAVRIVRDGPDRARLLQLSPAHRRVLELSRQPWAAPASAQAELAAALRALAGHFTVHSEATAGRALAAESRLVAQLTPRGGTLQVRLAVRPFHALGADVGPLLPPGDGRLRWVAQQGGETWAATRDLAAESAHLAALAEGLPFLDDPQAQPGLCGWHIADPQQALQAIETLGRHVAVVALEWPQGQPLRVIAPAEAQLQAVVKTGGRDWLGLDATLKVDDRTVLSLRQLLTLVNESRGSRYLPLAENAWLALTDRLRQQLADLAALAEAAPAPGSAKGRKAAAQDDGVQLPAAAAGWLADALATADGRAPAGDSAWQQRVTALAHAAALEPQVPPALQASLRPYQADGFAWLVRRTAAGFGVVLADDMGLGKTLQTLALLLYRQAEGPALVVAPTSVVANWAAEAARFAPGLRVRDHATEREAALADLAPGDVVLTSYGLLLRDIDAFTPTDWGSLVLDEAQALKNAATQRAKAVAELKAGARLALSGTPVENRLADLWSLMNLLNPGLLGNAQRFNERFANLIERQRDAAAQARLRRLVAPFILRRTKAQVLDDLPPRTEIVHRIEAGDAERALTEALRRDAVERVSQAAKSGGHAAVQVLAELTRLRRAACDPRLVLPELADEGLQQGGAKLQAIESLVLELVEGRHQALLFSQFTDFLDRIGERLQACGVPFQRLDGSTPAPQRAQRVAAFQRGEGAVFLISLKAGGFGLNLTAADYVIIADPWWNPAAEDQASGRAHRMGQQRPVTVYRLVLAGSVEERIVALHHDKRALADGLLEGQDAAGAVIDAEAMLALLRG
ncbi:SNF2-related protein [Aquabacterium sp. OR-4]|uniref:SNF2-related protein n=1 Tax=Aquabacterium sp. OR-4 TaxID=2978127 RepID=UPI0021B4703C|nr:DEAD/DEAH box helicase [Aquabacterium sp. OR-4]MDT7837804.1 DEAD/DEAH box helicase [Aquabacterium sp. OR-4]